MLRLSRLKDRGRVHILNTELMHCPVVARTHLLWRDAAVIHMGVWLDSKAYGDGVARADSALVVHVLHIGLLNHARVHAVWNLLTMNLLWQLARLNHAIYM